MRKNNLSLVPVAGSGASARIDRVATSLDDLFQPLPTLLSSGGDDRISLVSNTGLNMYGCSNAPRVQALELSSSTASSASVRAYQRLCRAREQLIERAAVKGLDEAFDQHIEHSRESLRISLGLVGSDAEVVFSPSGTDSQLHVLIIARAILGAPLTTIVVGSDQTGSGTAFTARGRHFNRRTGTGRAVLKGAPLTTRPGEFNCVDIPFAMQAGGWRSLSEIDVCVAQAVEAEVREGRKVLLQAMHASKFGLQGPSDACLSEIASRWPSDVLVVIDACQARIGQEKIRQYLSCGYAVLVTGSKFFMGPPFSGALLVPKCFSELVTATPLRLNALDPYLDRSCLPFAWPSIREQFALAPNLGQWLRWEAALEEMRLYQKLPAQFRSSVLTQLHRLIPDLIATSKHLVPLELPADMMQRAAADEEFTSATIYPFLVRTAGAYAPLSWAKTLCEMLNTQSEGNGRVEVDQVERPCHIGQPVALSLSGGIKTAAPRICVGSRNLFEAWAPGPGAVDGAVQSILLDVLNVVRRLDDLAERLG